MVTLLILLVEMARAGYLSVIIILTVLIATRRNSASLRKPPCQRLIGYTERPTSSVTLSTPTITVATLAVITSTKPLTLIT